MRLTLIDLFINQALIVIGVLASAPLARAAGLEGSWGTAGVGLVITPAVWTIGASWIYRRLRFFPLLAPVCAHCQVRPTSYEITAAPEWPRLRLRCGACEREMDVVMDRAVEAVSSSLPCLQLQWPEFLGRWRRAP